MPALPGRRAVPGAEGESRVSEYEGNLWLAVAAMAGCAVVVLIIVVSVIRWPGGKR